MKESDVVIHNVTGLHARPAKIFVNAAKQFQSTVHVQHNGKKVNAKSLISMLALGVKPGSQLRIVTEGTDEEVALQTLVEMVKSGLGEDHHLPQKQSETAAQTTPAAGASPHRAITHQTKTAALPDNVIQALAAAPGLAIGNIYKLEENQININEAFTTAVNEKERLQNALSQGQAELNSLREQMLKRSAAAEAGIFEAHLTLLDDPELLEEVGNCIGTQKSAAQAWQQAVQERVALIAQVDDPLLAARAADLRDVGNRILRLLLGLDESHLRPTLPDGPIIIVAHDLAPSDTAALDPQRVLGIATAAGGPTAHSAIIARALSLPAVVSAGEKLLALANGTTIILDGQSGTIIIDPDEETLAKAKMRQQALQKQKEQAQQTAAEPAVTKDGRRVEIAANIGGVKDAQKAHGANAEGVGLMRTEFLFLGRSEPPSEEEQFEVYRQIVEAMDGRPVIFRTLDIGGDKPLPYIDVPHEDNPFLGERGIRLCLNRPELLREQVRALLRAAAHGPLRIMFPMIGSILEWRQARAIVSEIQTMLNITANIEVGIMVEIPSAAIMADAFAAEVDFFSVGTNDLTQYTLAIDRMHPTMASHADGLHPAILRLIGQTVKAAHAAGKWVGVCGELGSDPAAVPILVGLGVDELSVGVPAVATTKALVRTLSYVEAQIIAQRALDCQTAQEVRQMMNS